MSLATSWYIIHPQKNTQQNHITMKSMKFPQKKTNKSILKNHPDLVSNDLIFVVCFSHRTKKKQLVFFPSTGWIHEFEGLSIEKWEGDFIIKNNETWYHTKNDLQTAGCVCLVFLIAHFDWIDSTMTPTSVGKNSAKTHPPCSLIWHVWKEAATFTMQHETLGMEMGGLTLS